MASARFSTSCIALAHHLNCGSRLCARAMGQSISHAHLVASLFFFLNHKYILYFKPVNDVCARAPCVVAIAIPISILLMNPTFQGKLYLMCNAHWYFWPTY